MSKEVTLKQIANELGVSTMTVSRALNGHSNVQKQTKERIIKKANELGYSPNLVAKSLVSNKTHTIGVVIPDISHHFFAQVISGIEKVAYQNNYQLLLTNSAENFEREKKALETLNSQRVDGILISCTMDDTQDLGYYKRLIKAGVPIVFFDRSVSGLEVSSVQVDDKEGARKATQHLIDHNYKKIGCFRGPDISIGKDRFLGYIQTMQKHDLEIKEDWILNSGFQEKGGYEAMKKILNMPEHKRPRAMVTVNDPAAIGAIEAMDDAGLTVPDDIAICGFSDDIRSRLLKVPLTTVRQRPYDIGRIAAEKLVKTLQNDDEPIEKRVITTELVIRESCGCKKN